MATYRHYIAIQFDTSSFRIALLSGLSPSGDVRVYSHRRWWSDFSDTGIHTEHPTMLLLDHNGEFEALGLKALRNFQAITRSLRHPKEVDNYYLFTNFNMYRNKEHLSHNLMIKAVNGKELPAHVVFTKVLKEIKEAIIQELFDRSIGHDHGPISPVQWILTVPAIWCPASEQIIREAATEAGLGVEDESSLLLVSEPEAAALYFHKEILSRSCEITNHYLLVDCGESTLNMTAHRMIKTKDGNVSIEELHQVLGGPYGSSNINDEFENLLMNLFQLSQADIAEVKQKYPRKWTKLGNEDFETANYVIDSRHQTPSTVPIHTKIRQFVENKIGKTMEDLCSEYKYHCIEWDDDEEAMFLDFSTMKSLCLPAVTHIIMAIKDVLQKAECQCIEKILMVGSFADHNILFSEVEKAFSRKLSVEKSSRLSSSLTVVKGAVFFGLHQHIIKSRKLRRSIGIETWDDFHDGSKKVAAEGIVLDPGISKTIAEAKVKGHTIEVRHAKVMVCGSSAAGKTNFINLLTGEKFVTMHKATVVTAAKDTMVKEIIVSENDENLVEFKTCDIQHQIHILQSHLFHKQYNKAASTAKAMVTEGVMVNENAVKLKLSDSVSGNKMHHGNTKPAPVSGNKMHHGNTKPASNSAASASSSIFTEESGNLASNHEMYKSSVEKKLAKVQRDIDKLPKTWNKLTFLDTGGQPEYISMLPAINSSVMLTFVIQSLEFDLSQKVTVFKGDDVEKDHTNPLPYDYKSLLKMLLSIRKPQIVKVPDEVLAKEGKRRSYLSFIGTKSDVVIGKLKNLDDVVDDINKELQRIVEEMVCVQDMLKFVGGKYITAVSNCNAGNIKDEDDNAKIIRTKLYEKLQETADVYHIPIPWLLLELEIKDWCEKNKRCYMKLQEIQDLCTRNSLPNNDEGYIKKFLKFYHILGVLLYYDINECRDINECDIIITNVQWFYNNLSKLVTYTTTNDSRFDYDHLLKIGLVTNEVFEKMEFDKAKDLGIDYFIKVFQYLGIIAVYAQSDKEIQYFVPCILLTCNLDSRGEISLLNKYGNCFEVEPLLLQTSGTEMSDTLSNLHYSFPRGAYSCLVVYLVKKENTRRFGKLNLLLSKKCLYSNLIIFQYFPNGNYDDQQKYYVVLVDRYNYLEIHLRCKSKPLRNTVYHQIRNLVYYSLNEVLRNLRFYIHDTCIAFKCSNCEEGCHLTRNTLEGIRLKQPFHCQQCKEGNYYSKSVWLQDYFTQLQNDNSKPGVVGKVCDLLHNSKPTYPVLLQYFMRVANWTILAAFLLNDKDGSITEKIKRNNHHDVNDCCAEMIREYIQNGDVSWQHVFKSLRNANLSNLASDMEKEMNINIAVDELPD